MPVKRDARSTREIIESCLKRGLTNADTLSRLRRLKPHTSLSLASVNHYRNRLREEGHKIPTEHAAKRR